MIKLGKCVCVRMCVYRGYFWMTRYEYIYKYKPLESRGKKNQGNKVQEREDMESRAQLGSGVR